MDCHVAGAGLGGCTTPRGPRQGSRQARKAGVLISDSRLPEALLLNQALPQEVVITQLQPLKMSPLRQYTSTAFLLSSSYNFPGYSFLHNAVGREGATLPSLPEKPLGAGEREVWRGM